MVVVPPKLEKEKGFNLIYGVRIGDAGGGRSMDNIHWRNKEKTAGPIPPRNLEREQGV